MPLWLEILALMLLTYAVGFAIGWAIWGQNKGVQAT